MTCLVALVLLVANAVAGSLTVHGGSPRVHGGGHANLHRLHEYLVARDQPLQVQPGSVQTLWFDQVGLHYLLICVTLRTSDTVLCAQQYSAWITSTQPCDQPSSSAITSTASTPLQTAPSSVSLVYEAVVIAPLTDCARSLHWRRSRADKHIHRQRRDRGVRAAERWHAAGTGASLLRTVSALCQSIHSQSEMAIQVRPVHCFKSLMSLDSLHTS